jgi:hypothetical protein
VKIGKILAPLVSSFVLVLAACNESPAPAVVSPGAGTLSAADATPKDSSAAPLASSAASVTVGAASPVPPAASSPAAAVVSAPATASAAASAPVAQVQVEVANIGLHIGGGPNDDVTKEPVLRSIEPHFSELRACYAKAEEPRQKGDFGIDLAIERDGGKAQVSKPRTGIKGEAFRACVVGVFESVEFRKPRGGKTVASYSVRFLPR